jgi:hypothetical protein
VKTFCLIVLLAACGGGSKPATTSPPPPETGSGSGSGSGGGETVTSCPEVKSIDCMPIVSPANQKYCEPTNRAWIQKNCPGIGYTD